MFRSGLNLRFADPSLTTEQVGAAIVFLAYIMYHAGPARAALMLFYLVAMLFGVLRLNATRLMVLALLAHRRARHGAAPHLPARSGDGRARCVHRVRGAGDRAAVVRGDGRLRQPAARAPVRQQPRAAAARSSSIEELAIRDELTGGLQPPLPDGDAGARALARRARSASRSRSAWSTSITSRRSTTASAMPPATRCSSISPRSRRAACAASTPSGASAARSSCWCCRAPIAQGALAVAERVRAVTEASAFPGLPVERRVTVTIGVATYARERGHHGPAGAGRPGALPGQGTPAATVSSPWARIAPR